MENICRLCCSSNFVNNDLFDEENALNLKMELFLPIKVIKGDSLPQKVCNRCSCKVNDIYQFCNIAIEAQDRLRSMLVQVDRHLLNDSIDLSLTKTEVQLPIVSDNIKIEQATQTEDIHKCTDNALDRLKDEPKSRTPSPIKRECSIESDHCDPGDIPSDNSDNISLISLKKKKRGRKPNANGEASVKKGRKKKAKLKDWDFVINALPGDMAVSLVQKPEDPVEADVKRESIETEYDTRTMKTTIEVKKEPTDVLADKETYQCCICFTQCYSRTDTLQHYRQHAVAESGAPPPPPPPAPVPPRCTRCRKVVEGGDLEWAMHWARHWARDTRPYRCALCEKAFRDPHQILKHGETHKAGEGAAPLNKRFICDLCPEGFVYMRYLLSHRSRAHPEAAGRALSLRCAVCARSFAHLNSLRRHLRAHSGERNHLCSVCGKALSSREHLKFHLRIHTGYKPNVCKTCGKGFVKKCNLTLHERVHSGEKPHVCSHCGKAFSQRSTLVIHERLREEGNLKPHVCSHCGKAFSQRSMLVIHERYHSGARPYVCALCKRGFVAKGLLSMHLKTTCI